MSSCIFTNDDNISILLLNHSFSHTFMLRDNHEILFRRIHTFLIKHNIIKNNIIDLGAWIGDNTIPWAMNIKDIVYAIDPSSDNCNFIINTCELNQINNVKVLQHAISDKHELLTTNNDINHCSFIYSGKDGINKINAVSLDYLFDNKTIENIGYIHLDVEGMEYNVIKGSSNIIDTCRPVISFEQHLEIDDYDIILSYLLNKNYKVFLIDEILPGCREDCRNSLAFPTETYSEDIIHNINTLIGKNVMIPKL